MATRQPSPPACLVGKPSCDPRPRQTRCVLVSCRPRQERRFTHESSSHVSTIIPLGDDKEPDGVYGGRMIDALGIPFRHYLADHCRCVLIGTEKGRPTPLLVPYRAQGLEIDCLLPLWAELTYCLEQDPHVILVIPTLERTDCWLQICGTAHLLSAPDWSALLPHETMTVSPDDLYRVVRVRPYRLDLHDGRRGWGARETLEVGRGVGEV